MTVTTLIGYVLPFSTNEQQLWKLAGRCKQCRGRYLLGGTVRSGGGRGGEALNDVWLAIVNKHGARKTICSSKTMEHYSVAQRELQVYAFLLFSS